jgi:hypothetical protein
MYSYTFNNPIKYFLFIPQQISLQCMLWRQKPQNKRGIIRKAL